MANPKLTDDELIKTHKVFLSTNRNTQDAAKELGIDRRSVSHRIKLVQERFPDGVPETTEPLKQWTYPKIIRINAPHTRWIIGSDLHCWGGNPTLTYQAFVQIAHALKVDGIILNGDIIDGARISRHGIPLRSHSPKISKEIETAKKWISMLPNTKYRCWTVGNHDIRLDNYIAANASELDDYIMSLQEHFPSWEMAYAFEINGNTEIRHRYRSGIHAAWNNTLHSGVNMITGHTHQLSVTAQRDRRGSRYGIETGMLADPDGPQFEYTEGTPSRAQPGFVVITFDTDGEMLPPETCEIIRGRPIFRGDPIL